MTSLRGAPFVVLVVAGVVLGARPAYAQQVHANAARCVRTAEEGQRARAAGQLRDARDRFYACASDACPVVVRQDCGTWASEVTALVPTIVVDARDVNGRDVADVIVRVDGEVIANKLDGKTLSVDPGPHTLTFERIGFEPVSEKAIIKEGMKARAFVVSFDVPRSLPATTDQSTPAIASGSHTVWPWLVVGGGVAIATVGVILLATAPPEQSCLGSDGACIAAQDGDLTARRDHQVWGGVTLGVGVLVAAGGLLWHVFEPTGQRRANVASTFGTF